MKKLILLVLIAAVGWKVYDKQTVPVITNADVKQLNTPIEQVETSPVDQSHYSCDGRQYCSQMSSCKEAMFFIQNCPNTKMDGNHDGIPCERQHCN